MFSWSRLLLIIIFKWKIKKLRNCWLSNGLEGHKTITLTGSLPTLTSSVCHAGMQNTQLNPSPGLHYKSPRRDLTTVLCWLASVVSVFFFPSHWMGDAFVSVASGTCMLFDKRRGASGITWEVNMGCAWTKIRIYPNAATLWWSREPQQVLAEL